MKPNAATQRILTEGEQLKALVASEGWRVARKKLNERLIELGDIFSLDLTDTVKLAVDLRAKQIALDLVVKWTSEIEGIATAHDDNRKIFQRIQKEHFIEELPGEE